MKKTTAIYARYSSHAQVQNVGLLHLLDLHARSRRPDRWCPNG